MKLGPTIRYYRKKKGLTQEALAELVGVSFQAVSSWEKDDYLPQMDKAEALANALDISIADIYAPIPNEAEHDWQCLDQMFSEEHAYKFVRSYANSAQAGQTRIALPYARECHKGQTRKGGAGVPYIYHPLVMACHALAMHLNEDDLIATILLHDVCEDCRNADGGPILPTDLPVNATVQEAVRLLTKPAAKYDHWKDDYYQAIAGNRLATITKVLDRCNNISLMATGFSTEKMASYIEETERFIMPLLDIMKHDYEDTCYNAAFLLKYQMLSTIENLKRLL